MVFQRFFRVQVCVAGDAEYALGFHLEVAEYPVRKEIKQRSSISMNFLCLDGRNTIRGKAERRGTMPNEFLAVVRSSAWCTEIDRVVLQERKFIAFARRPTGTDKAGSLCQNIFRKNDFARLERDSGRR